MPEVTHVTLAQWAASLCLNPCWARAAAPHMTKVTGGRDKSHCRCQRGGPTLSMRGGVVANEDVEPRSGESPAVICTILARLCQSWEKYDKTNCSINQRRGDCPALPFGQKNL